MLKTFFLGSVFLLFFVGCSSAPLIKNQVTPVSGVTVKYIYPNDVKQSDLSFRNYNSSTPNPYDSSHVTNKGVSSFDRGGHISIVKYHRLDYSDTLESTNEYRVKLEINKNTITLTPYENIINQNSLLKFAPYEIPVFTSNELVNILLSTTHKFNFEVDSKFQSDSVSANFKRLASRDFSKFSSAGNIYENSYYIALEEADVRVDVKTYPYQNGSKCTVAVSYITKPSESNVVSIKEIEEKIKAKIVSIVNA